MMAGEQLPFWRRSTPPRLMLVSDLVQNEDPTHTHLLRFNALWQSLFGHDSLLVYSTGRSPHLYRALWEEAPLLTPQVLICSVGTEVFYLSELGAAAPTSSAPTTSAGTAGASSMADAPGPASTAPPAAAAAAATTDGGPGPGVRVAYVPDPEWEALLDRGWDRDRVLRVARRFPQLHQQVASEQRRHKLSFHLEPPTGQRAAADPEALGPEEVITQLQASLAAEGLQVKVVYSGGRDLDLLAAGAGKGAALQFLLGRLQAAGCAPEEGLQVNGDSGNDIELFEVSLPGDPRGAPGPAAASPYLRGCVVSNAYPELRAFAQKEAARQQQGGAAAAGGGVECAVFQATLPCAGGILQAMQHFGSLPHHPDELPAEARVRLAALEALASLFAPPVRAAPEAAAAAAAAPASGGAGAPGGVGGGAEAVGSGAGGVRVSGREAEAVGDDAAGVCALAAAAAAAGVWVDRVAVVPPAAMMEVVEAGGAEGAAGAMEATGPGTGAAAAAAGVRNATSYGAGAAPTEWEVSCHVYQLRPSTGTRNLDALRTYLLRVEPSGDDGGGSGGGGGVGCSDPQLGYGVTGHVVYGMGLADVALPDGV